LGVTVGDDVRFETCDTIQPVEKPDSLEAFNIIQRGGKSFIDEDRAFGALCIAGLNRSARRLDEGAMDDSNCA
jgi:hypothetical protein